MKGVNDALDHCGNTYGFVVAGDGQFLHIGRIHPHLAGVGDYRCFGSPHSGSQSGLAAALHAVVRYDSSG